MRTHSGAQTAQERRANLKDGSHRQGDNSIPSSGLVADYVTMLIRLALATSFFCVCHLLAAAAVTNAPQVIRYTIASNGKVAGSEVDTYYPEGRIDSTFEFNDRGRGPKVSSKYQLDAGGLPVRVDETGNDYLKAPVDEHFEVANGTASWRSTSEKGEAPAGAF